MRDLQSIIVSANASLHELLHEAFDAGRAIGREEASNDLRSRIADIIGSMEPRPLAVTPPMPRVEVPQHDTTKRAQAGTVKPVILDVIRHYPSGIRTAQIVTMTGAKPNSVRGTLFTLNKEKQIERRGELWFLRQKTEAAGKPRATEQPAASNQEPGADGREAGPGGGT